MSKTLLFDNYYVAEVGAEEWEAFVTENSALAFPHEQSVSFDPVLTAAERTRLGALRQNLARALTLHLLLYENDTPIGWHYGFQRSELEYFMANTALLPAYQGRGIYSAFLKYAIGRILEEGFQYITSIHHADNHAVLIPKLKAGFLIQAFGLLIQPMLLESNYGTMIQLVYPAKDIYRQVLGYRLGTQALHAEMRRQLPE